MKIINIEVEEEDLHIFWNIWGRNINDIFRKDVIYDNIKRHKKSWLRPLSEKYIFGKLTLEGEEHLPPQTPLLLPLAFLGLRELLSLGKSNV